MAVAYGDLSPIRITSASARDLETTPNPAGFATTDPFRCNPRTDLFTPRRFRRIVWLTTVVVGLSGFADIGSVRSSVAAGEVRWKRWPPTGVVSGDRILLVVVNASEPDGGGPPSRPRPNADDPAVNSPLPQPAAFWCRSAMERLIETRTAAIGDHGYVRYAGLPSPSRPVRGRRGPPTHEPVPAAVLFLLDQDQRILAWSIGVPNPGQFDRLLDDASFWADQERRPDDDASRQAWFVRIADRVSPPYRRRWVGEDEFAHRLRTWYFTDARRRFAAGTVRRRMRVEQMAETAEDYCLSVTPWLVGGTVDETARPFIESIWHRPALLSGRADTALVGVVRDAVQTRTPLTLRLATAARPGHPPEPAGRAEEPEADDDELKLPNVAKGNDMASPERPKPRRLTRRTPPRRGISYNDIRRQLDDFEPLSVSADDLFGLAERGWIDGDDLWHPTPCSDVLIVGEEVVVVRPGESLGRQSAAIRTAVRRVQRDADLAVTPAPLPTPPERPPR